MTHLLNNKILVVFLAPFLLGAVTILGFSPYNLTLSTGSVSTNSIITSIKKGFYVTEMLGMSFNPVNGDYSRGAAGFMIENGEITFPINEVTIAGNMNSILKDLIPADDLLINENINSPTILVEKMTLAGI